MKLALAGLVYLVIALVLGAGILLLVAGKPWPLIIAFLLYAVAFGRTCWLPQH
jgi:lipopolysaccharide export LptBFGC system permease protein LptF